MMRKDAGPDLSPYRTLVYRLLAMRSRKPETGVAFCLTSVRTGDGVSHVTKHLTQALQQACEGRIQQITFADLQAPGKGMDPISSAEAALSELVQQNDIVLLDCPALRSGGEALAIASLVDGVLLVVQADRTTKAEVMVAEQTLHDVGGTMFGFVLNRKPARLWPFQRK